MLIIAAISDKNTTDYPVDILHTEWMNRQDQHLKGRTCFVIFLFFSFFLWVLLLFYSNLEFQDLKYFTQ